MRKVSGNKIKCPKCNSSDLAQGILYCCGYSPEFSPSHYYTTRKEREAKGLKVDDAQTLEARPDDDTWLRCIMCNTEFDDDGNIYAERKMWGFDYFKETANEKRWELIKKRIDAGLSKEETIELEKLQAMADDYMDQNCPRETEFLDEMEKRLGIKHDTVDRTSKA